MIHAKICNRLDPATTEKLVFVYSNSKLVASTCDADKLKMFAWDNEDVEVLHCRLVPSGWTGPGAEAPRRLVAQFCARRKAPVAAPRLGAPLPTMVLAHACHSAHKMIPHYDIYNDYLILCHDNIITMAVWPLGLRHTAGTKPLPVYPRPGGLSFSVSFSASFSASFSVAFFGLVFPRPRRPGGPGPAYSRTAAGGQNIWGREEAPWSRASMTARAAGRCRGGISTLQVQAKRRGGRRTLERRNLHDRRNRPSTETGALQAAIRVHS